VLLIPIKSLSRLHFAKQDRLPDMRFPRGPQRKQIRDRRSAGAAGEPAHCDQGGMGGIDVLV